MLFYFDVQQITFLLSAHFFNGWKYYLYGMISEQFFLPKYEPKVPQSQTVIWSAPSNIALVKYWGKKPVQLPANASVSFTLSNCKTITEVTFSAKKLKNHLYSFDILVDDDFKESFRPKIESFFDKAQEYLPFLSLGHFQIRTTNTFPHSSGIASSASGMAALALCLMSIEKSIDPTISEDFFLAKASFLARLGSGSACRSIKGSMVAWGSHPAVPNSSDLFGVTLNQPWHEFFEKYQDTILIVEEGQKQVSSSTGHELMHNHPFGQQRIEQAQSNLTNLITAMNQGDLDEFIAIVESEALTLHAMMMTSNPAFLLMQPATLSIIKAVWDFRKSTQIPLCFTLDAGANVHLLYPKSAKSEVLAFIEEELVVYCENGRYICDEVGEGSIRLNDYPN